MVMGSSNTNDAHTILHTNLKILQKCIPPTQAFEDIFTEAMFRIPNRKGFDQVIYYLLSIINPKRVKQYICWPLFDAKDERQFRTAVVNFVSDINKEDSSAHIPHLVPSSLQSPSGDSIAYFLQQISSYCLRTHLNISCDFICSSVLDTTFSARKKIIIQEIKTLEKKLSSGNIEKKILLSRVITALNEYKRLKLESKEEKLKLRRILTEVPDYVKQYWTGDLYNNILDWTKHLNKQTEKLADIVLKLKCHHETISDLNELIKGTVGRKHPFVLNVQCGEGLISNSNSKKDFRTAVCDSSGKLKLVNLLDWVKLTCKDLSSELQQKDGIDESIFQTDAAVTDITNCFHILKNIEKQIDENLSTLRASVASRKKRCDSSTCLFTPLCSTGQEIKRNIILDISDFLKVDETEFLRNFQDCMRREKQKSLSNEGVYSTENKVGIASDQNSQKLYKCECEEKTVTEVPYDSKLEQQKKPTKIPVFNRKFNATTKLFEQENMNKTPNIKTRSGTKNLPEIVTNTPPSTVTKDYMDSLVDTLYSPPHTVVMDDLQIIGNRTFDEQEYDSINDSLGILDNLSHSALEDAAFPSNFCDTSAANNSFVSPEFVPNTCDKLNEVYPTETETSSTPPPPVKRKARPSIQALIDRYYALKGNTASKGEEAIESEH